MAQYRKDVFNLAGGLGRALSDPREAEARAKEASNRAQQDMIQRHRIQQRELELREQAAQQRLAQAQARMSAPTSYGGAAPQGSMREQALQRLMSSMGITPRFGSTASHDLGAGAPQMPGPGAPVNLPQDPRLGLGTEADRLQSMIQNQQQAQQGLQGQDAFARYMTGGDAMQHALDREFLGDTAKIEAKELEAARYADKKALADAESARKGGESWAKIMQAMNAPGMLAAELASREKVAGIQAGARQKPTPVDPTIAKHVGEALSPALERVSKGGSGHLSEDERKRLELLKILHPKSAPAIDEAISRHELWNQTQGPGAEALSSLADAEEGKDISFKTVYGDYLGGAMDWLGKFSFSPPKGK